eukprot:scaffold157180_cov34-Prasinocladus_malaysianus.AAC.1
MCQSITHLTSQLINEIVKEIFRVLSVTQSFNSIITYASEVMHLNPRLYAPTASARFTPSIVVLASSCNLSMNRPRGGRPPGAAPPLQGRLRVRARAHLRPGSQPPAHRPRGRPLRLLPRRGLLPAPREVPAGGGRGAGHARRGRPRAGRPIRNGQAGARAIRGPGLPARPAIPAAQPALPDHRPGGPHAASQVPAGIAPAERLAKSLMSRGPYKQTRFNPLGNSHNNFGHATDTAQITRLFSVLCYLHGMKKASAVLIHNFEIRYIVGSDCSK